LLNNYSHQFFVSITDENSVE